MIVAAGTVLFLAAAQAPALAMVQPAAAAHDTTAAKPKSALQRCLDSTLALNRAVSGKVQALSEQNDSLGVRAALQPMRSYAKVCETSADAKSATGADVGVLGTVELLAGDFAAGQTTLQRYSKDEQVPKVDRSLTIETAQRLAAVSYQGNDRAGLFRQFIDLADSVGFPRGRLNTRIYLAQVYRGAPATTAKAYPLIREMLTIAKDDPDTTTRAKRARPIGMVVKMAQEWAAQDGKPYDGQAIVDMANQTFGAYPGYKVMFDATALIGTAAEPIKAPRWLNAGTATTKTFGDGKVYLVEFTAHWCSPCRASYATLKAFAEKYKAKGLEIMYATQTYGYFGEAQGMSADAELDSLTHYFAEHKITDPVAISGAFTGASQELVQANNFLNYGANGLPTVVLIDRKGVVRNLWQGWGDESEMIIQSFLERLLNEGQGVTPPPAGASKGR